MITPKAYVAGFQMPKTSQHAFSGWSSFTYSVSVASLAPLHDAPDASLNGVAVYLGRNRAAPSGIASDDDRDVLLAGRDLIARALADNTPFLPVRFFFRGYSPALLRWPLHLFAPYKRRVYFVSSAAYNLDLAAFGQLRLLRQHYTRDTAYSHCSRFRNTPAAERVAEYDKLVASMRNGFNPEFPLRVMLRRDLGLRDTLRDGHHRLMAARDAGLAQVPVRFVFAGHAPRFLLCN